MTAVVVTKLMDIFQRILKASNDKFFSYKNQVTNLTKRNVVNFYNLHKETSGLKIQRILKRNFMKIIKNLTV